MATTAAVRALDGDAVGTEIAGDDERVSSHGLGCALGDDPARFERVHAIAQAHEKGHVVLDEEDAAAQVVTNPAQQRAERLRLALRNACPRPAEHPGAAPG